MTGILNLVADISRNVTECSQCKGNETMMNEIFVKCRAKSRQCPSHITDHYLKIFKQAGRRGIADKDSAAT